MQGKLYLYLLILCGIWSLGFIGAFADENITGSSTLSVRHKRVVSHVQNEDIPVRIDDHPYVVNIKIRNRIFCVGTILSNHVVITAAECANEEKREYKVISSSSLSNRAVVSHNVTDVKVHYGNHPDRPADGIALFIVDPPIAYSRFSYKISLRHEPVLPNMEGIVTGWGYNVRNGVERGTEWPSNLRSIKVPIMAHQTCVNIYRRFYRISDKDICTFHPQRRTGHKDGGAPLVIDGFLAGIFLRRGPLRYPYNTEYPDVYAFLQHLDYRTWINANII